MKTEEAFKEIRDKGINERLKINYISNNEIKISRNDRKYSFIIYKVKGYSLFYLVGIPNQPNQARPVRKNNMNDMFYYMLNYLDNNDTNNLLEVLLRVEELWEF